MKTYKNILLIVGLIVVTFVSCKKDAGFGGSTNIKGTVTLNGTAVSGAIVYIAVGTKEATTSYNTSTVTDANGAYVFNALNAGDYFVDAEFTNNIGIKFGTGGSHVYIGGKKGDVTVDLTLE